MTKTTEAHADDITLLTQTEVAKRWRCCKLTVRRMMRSGFLPYIQLGRAVRFDLTDIKRVEANGRMNAPR